MAGSRWEALVGAACAEVAPTSALRVAALVAPGAPALLDVYLGEGALGRRVELSTEAADPGTTRLRRTSRRPYHDVCALVVGEGLSCAGILEGGLDLALADPSATPWLGELVAALACGGVLVAFDTPAARAALLGPLEVSSVAVDGVSLLVVRRGRSTSRREESPWSTLDRCACVDRERVAAVLAVEASSPVREVPEWGLLRERLAAAVDARLGDPALGAALLGDALTLARAPERPGVERSSRCEEAGSERGVDLLLLVPHPDDETVYFGGVVAAASRAGLRLHVATLTGGEGGLDLRGDRGSEGAGAAWESPKGEDPGRGLARIRAQEQARALAALGAGACAQQGLGFADTGKYLDRRRALPMPASEALLRWGPRTLIDRLVALFRQIRPRCVVTMDPIRDPNYSLHAHHLGCGAAALVAAGLAGDGGDDSSSLVGLWTVQPAHVGAELRLRGGRAEGAAPRGAEFPQVAEIPVDIDRKIAALAAYPSQSYSTQRLIASLERARAAGEVVHEVLLLRARLSPGTDPIQLLLGTSGRSF